MTPESIDCAILFADISGSTNLYDMLGDERAHKVVSTYISVLSEVIAKHHGAVIKTIGDEVMCTFDSSDHAVHSAIEMHKTLDSLPSIVTEKRIRPNIRIGIHVGPVIRQKDDVFGDAVNIAARMVELAKPRQIIATQQVIDALPRKTGMDIKCVDKTTIKGKTGEHSIYEIIWEEDTLTILFPKDINAQTTESCLRLTLGKKELAVDSDLPVVTLGRQAQNDLVVSDIVASRTHAHVEYRRGKFVLIDQSTNGTYVNVDGEDPVFLHHDEFPLTGSGFISLGRAVDPESPDSIRFVLEVQ
ncbi:MAG: adenylate/guanylate cyclase domain-containing protein [Desulfomonilia bacterium]